MKSRYTYMIMLLTAMLLTACDVHEFGAECPVPPQPGEKCMLNLHFDNDDFDYLTTVGTEGRSRAGHSPERDLRVIVRLYPTGQSANKTGRATSRNYIDFYSNTFADDGSHPDIRIPIDVDPGEYQLVAWADHVMPGTSDDLYYTSTDLFEVRLPGSGQSGYIHNGNDIFREAWRGMASIIVKNDGSVSLVSRADENIPLLTVQMERPLARYHFVTNDLRKFFESEGRRLSEQSADAPGLKAPNLDDYRVVVRYTGYMNCAFNVLADKPMDSAMGVIYEGSFRQLDEDRAEIAFDHVFVNHAQTSVQVALELYRRSDNMRLSSTGVINVPLRRGHYTLIEGPLLTTMAGASTGIVPDFNGEFNIEIR